ncbi:uncharacterized protein LOC105210262 [Zeugodacus cucurbitae]|uniref:HLA class I histocompatibility antigen, A-80 alpha chain n=1 Tax=Zeugodacus cucurbitae TaxID=28588 RepID=A0A0A1XAH0_ZEUCU|nr:uncharacterized protein LOC105210262 [Zeugodacus cucurbitae]
MGLIKYGILLATLTLALAETQNECVVPVSSKGEQWPLIYKPSGELYPVQLDAEQRSASVHLPVGEEVLLSCGPNYLKNFNRAETLSVKCDSDGKLKSLTISSGLQNKPKPANYFGCDLRVVEEVLSTVNGCNNRDWTPVAYGYVNPWDNLTHIIGEACYDENEGRTRFAHIKLSSTGYPQLQRLPKFFLTRFNHPDGRYKSELFRGLRFDEIYQRVRQTLHLKTAPFLHIANYVDDFFILNPQFQAVKKLGWNYFVSHDELEAWTELKRDILAHQKATKEDMDIYVGSHGVQVLYGLNGEQMSFYLHPDLGEDGKFPVPELLWIVVKEEDKATAFGVYNDANANAVHRSVSTTPHAPICESKCGEITWLSDALKNSGVICCSVSQFRKVVKEVPELTEEDSLL